MSISAALFSDSQSRVYRWLFGHPERSFHLSELLRLTGLGSASLQRELGKLAAAGLVHSEKVGNLRRFQANKKSPVYEELASLTRKTLGAQPLLREALAPIEAKLDLAFIYGSIAKGAETAASDIDVAVVGCDLLLSDLLKLLLPAETQLGRKINPTLYTPAEFKRRRAQKDSFLNRVLAQPVIPLIGGEALGRGRSR
jgi:predicted nucleotidyltransferase